MLRSALRILVILAISAGVAAGYVRLKGLDRAKGFGWIPDPAAVREVEDRYDWIRRNRGIPLDDLLTRIEQGAIVIDARPTDEYAEGHLALDPAFRPPVLNVAPGTAEEQRERLEPLLDFGWPVILYCASETCDDALEVYDELTDFGFQDIWVYLPGWKGIVAAGLPTEAGPDIWTGFDYLESAGSEPNEPNTTGSAAEPNSVEPNAPAEDQP